MGIESKVREAIADTLVPDGCPPKQLFIQLSLLTLLPDTPERKAFHGTWCCWECFSMPCLCLTQQSCPAGILHHLFVPWCPWSYIYMDFITRLPFSETNRFSRKTFHSSYSQTAKEIRLLYPLCFSCIVFMGTDVKAGPVICPRFFFWMSSALCPNLPYTCCSSIK